MEDTIKEQQPSSALMASNGKSKLKYPLRSSTTKLKGEKSPTENPISSEKRGRGILSVSKSVSFANDKSDKPPRRLSNPAKRTFSPRPKPDSKNILTSETRVRRSLTSQGKNESSTRPKFNVLSSPSYWLSQIKLSESVPNHDLSLGFFKLALQAGCQPLQRLCDELKSYILKHNMIKLKETVVEEILKLYGISETLEQMRVEGGTQTSIELSPKVVKLNSSKATTQTSQLQGKTVGRKSVTPKLAADRKTVNKINQLPSNGQVKIKQEKKSAGEVPSIPVETEKVVYCNKENMDAAAVLVDEIRVT